MLLSDVLLSDSVASQGVALTTMPFWFFFFPVSFVICLALHLLVYTQSKDFLDVVRIVQLLLDNGAVQVRDDC